jgi:SulP family sulfate permease
MLNLIGPAFAIAVLGGIESLLSAVVADGMTGKRHNSNRELIGQGIANIITPMFGGIPATGAIARTATNIKSGAVSPLSGIFHGIVVLGTLLLFAPYAAYIPLAAMAPILMMVAWNMSERHEFLSILKMKTGDSLVLVITFILTVFFDLTTAVEIGLLLAMVLFVSRMGKQLQVEKSIPDHEGKRGKMSSNPQVRGNECPQIGIYTIDGPLFFGAAHQFHKDLIDSKPQVLLLRMGRVPFIDATGQNHLEIIVENFQKRGGRVLTSGLKGQPLSVFKKSGLYEKIGGHDYVFPHTGEALNLGLSLINKRLCQGCPHRTFKECTKFAAHPIKEAQ